MHGPFLCKALTEVCLFSWLGKLSTERLSDAHRTKQRLELESFWFTAHVLGFVVLLFLVAKEEVS